MRLRVIFGVLAIMWVVGVSQHAGAAQGKTVWDGVFSEAQAKRGAEEYTKNCSECHGKDLMGDGFAPALTGAEFMGNWNDLSIGDLYERIRISMPPSGPSAVSPAQKADIMAHLMNMNKWPAGSGELEPKTEALKQIKIVMKQ